MTFTIAQFQTSVYEDKNKNIEQMEVLFERHLKKKRIDLVSFPEMFTTPYETALFPKYAEPEGGESWQRCSQLAKKYGVYFAAGSMPEIDEAGKIYNTAYIFDRQGRQIGKHRKVHLFDVDIQGGQYFKESDTLSPGNQPTVFQTEFGPMGICICYDLRFPELSRCMVDQGAKVILVPASFNLTTGPIHWELLFRQRAIDNQCYYLGTSSARNPKASYQSWGHTIAVSPWGEVLHQLGQDAGMQMTEIDLDYVDAIRQQLPLLAARRRDLY